MLRRKFLKYYEIARMNYLENTAYIGDVLGFAGVVMLHAWMYTQLYRSAFSFMGAKQIAGFTLPMTIWILLLSRCLQSSSRVKKHIRELSDDIKSGNISYAISKPYSYFLFHIWSAAGYSFSFLIFLVPLVALVLLLLVGSVHVTVLGVVFGIILAVTGLLLNTIIIFILGLSAFWIEDSSAFRWIYDKILWTLGGVFIPVAFLPGIVRQISQYSPFGNLFAPSARTVIQFDWNFVFLSLSLQFFWIGACTLIAVYAFRKGVRKLSVNGG